MNLLLISNTKRRDVDVAKINNAVQKTEQVCAVTKPFFAVILILLSLQGF